MSCRARDRALSRGLMPSCRQSRPRCWPRFQLCQSDLAQRRAGALGCSGELGPPTLTMSPPVAKSGQSPECRKEPLPRSAANRACQGMDHSSKRKWPHHRCSALEAVSYIARRMERLRDRANSARHQEDPERHRFRHGSIHSIADARLHEQLGRIDRAERKHNFAASGNPMRPPAAKEFYFCRPPAMEYNARYERVSEHSEIVAVHVRIGIAAKHRQAAAVANADVGNRRAALGLHHFTILIIEDRNPKRPGRLQHGWSYGVGIARRFHMDEAALAALLWIWCSLPILQTTV